ncbi:MAG: ABC transporter permease [Bacillota bacterium]
MYVYIIRRVLTGIPVILGVLTVVFLSLHLTPGDPIDLLIPADVPAGAGEELAAQLRARYGLDQPLHTQFIMYMKRALTLDFGESIRTRRPVAPSLLERYPATIELAIFAMAAAMLVGIPAGIVSAIRQNSVADNISMTISLLGVSLPNFWLGLLLMLLFGLRLGWLPLSGRIGGFWSVEAIKHLLMPALTIGVAAMGILARLTRSAMLDVLREDYIRTARAKGLRERVVIYRHALKNALIPVITVLGLQFGGLLAGAVIAETIFAWPGIGRYMVLGITGNDFPAVQGGVVFVAATFVVVNLGVDLLYGFLDPRISYS